MHDGPLLVFSPHLDDGVLSLGGALARRPGSVVVTVLAGLPADESVLTAWDRRSGFTSAGQAMRVRWYEDARALHLLGATPVHLTHIDGMYGRNDPGSVTQSISEIAAQHPGLAAVGLMGLVHPDHVLVADCFLAAMQAAGREHWVAADIPYSLLDETVAARQAELRERGITLTPHDDGAFDMDLKLQARGCYASQLRSLTDAIDLPERCWKVGRD